MSLEFSSKASGTDDLKAVLEHVKHDSMPIVAEALYQFGEDIMRVSAQDWVPVEWGTLRDTGFVDPPVDEGDGVTVRLHYGGGPASDYAVIQHENLDFNHPTGGRAKYLEGPFLEAVPDLGAAIAEALGSEL